MKKLEAILMLTLSVIFGTLLPIGLIIGLIVAFIENPKPLIQVFMVYATLAIAGIVVLRLLNHPKTELITKIILTIAFLLFGYQAVKHSSRGCMEVRYTQCE